MFFTPSELQAFLSEHNLHPKKSLSQNFLIDRNIVCKIIKTAQIEPQDTVLEIGPGLGVLTSALLEAKALVIAIEKDDLFAKFLQEQSACVTVHADFLKISLPDLLKGRSNIKVVANLPYQISSPALFQLIENAALFSSAVIMLQKEMAQRLLSPVNTKTYGPLALLVQYFTKARIAFTVPASCFYPKPHVNSQVLTLQFKKVAQPKDMAAFIRFTESCFTSRRKKLLSILGKEYGKEKLAAIFTELRLNPSLRAENLTGEKMLALFWQLFE